MKKIWEKWKNKWAVESDKRMLWIFLIFAITGSSTVFIRKGLFNMLGVDISQPLLAFLVKIVAIYIIYQFLLFIIGSLMGEHKFVKWFLLKMNRHFIPARKSK